MPRHVYRDKTRPAQQSKSSIGRRVAASASGLLVLGGMIGAASAAGIHAARRTGPPPCAASAGAVHRCAHRASHRHHPHARTAAVSPSGRMPRGNIPGWRQVFADDFTTDVPLGGFSGCQPASTLQASQCSGLPSQVAAKWFAYPDGWPDTSRHGNYYPSKVLSIHNGVLDYWIHTENGTHMVAAPEPKLSGAANGQLYGRYVVRFRSDLLPGYKTAWLLWPDSEVWPSQGEIDFPEGNLDSGINAFMHHMGASSGSEQDAYPTSITYQSWHTATIEWTPSYCRFTLDGRVLGTSTAFVPSDPMHWVLQTETAMDGIPADSTAGHVRIAWVVAYAPDAGLTPPLSPSSGRSR